jgi:hypothetical protein
MWVVWTKDRDRFTLSKVMGMEREGDVQGGMVETGEMREDREVRPR